MFCCACCGLDCPSWSSSPANNPVGFPDHIATVHKFHIQKLFKWVAVSHFKKIVSVMLCHHFCVLPTLSWFFPFLLLSCSYFVVMSSAFFVQAAVVPTPFLHHSLLHFHDKLSHFAVFHPNSPAVFWMDSNTFFPGSGFVRNYHLCLWSLGCLVPLFCKFWSFCNSIQRFLLFQVMMTHYRSCLPPGLRQGKAWPRTHMQHKSQIHWGGGTLGLGKTTESEWPSFPHSSHRNEN